MWAMERGLDLVLPVLSYYYYCCRYYYYYKKGENGLFSVSKVALAPEQR